MPSLLGFRADFIARTKIGWWHNRAWMARSSGNLTRALELFGRCAALADGIGDEQLHAEMLVERADVLLRLGRLKEAMVVVAPVLPEGRLRADAVVSLDALLIWFDGANQLLVSASALDRVLRMAEDHVVAIGRPEWRYMVLQRRALKLVDQGRFDEALALLREGWSIWLRHREILFPSGVSLAMDIANVAERLVRPDEIRRVLSDLALVTPTDPDHLRTVLYCRYELGLAEGHYDDALMMRQQMTALSRHTDDPRRKLEDLYGEAYVRMCAQHIAQARRHVVELFGMRHDSSLLGQYYFRLLCVDVHLAAARRALGLPSIDPDIGVPGPVGPPDEADPIDPAREVHRARVACRAVSRLVDRLDKAAEGTGYRDRLYLRQVLLDELPV